MDQSRRQALRALGVVASTVASSTTLAYSTKTTASQATTTSATTDRPIHEPDQFSIQIEHSWASDDINLVIKNISAGNTVITEIAPSYIVAEPGLFCFHPLLSAGSITLAPHQELRVPFTRTSEPTWPLSHFDRSLQEAVSRSLKINTQHHSHASITTIFNPRIV